MVVVGGGGDVGPADPAGQADDQVAEAAMMRGAVPVRTREASSR